MHRAVLESGSGINFRDTDGNELTAIGNVTYQAGDAVWTDGRVIYGWVRPNQPHRLSWAQSGGIPWLVAGIGVTASAWYLPPTTPQDYTRIGEYDEAAWGTRWPSFIVGKNDAAFIVEKVGRKATNLKTGDTFTLETPARAHADYALVVLDATVQGGDLLLLEVYEDISGEYYGYAVHRNGDIIDEYDGIEGGTHAATVEQTQNVIVYWRDAGVVFASYSYYRRETVEIPAAYLEPLFLHLRQDGTFCGTMSEHAQNALLQDTDTVRNTDIQGDMGGVILYDTDRGSWSPAPARTVSDIRTVSVRFRPTGMSEYFTFTPFADIVSVEREETLTASGSVFRYDDGAKTEVYRQDETDEMTYYAPAIFDGVDFSLSKTYYMTGEDSGTQLPYTVECTQCTINTDTQSLFDGSRYLCVHVRQNGNVIMAAIYGEGLIPAAATTTKNSWYGTQTVEKTETGTAFSLDVDGNTVSCETPQSVDIGSGLWAFGRIWQYRILPQYINGAATFGGMTFAGRENAVYDVKSIGGGRYLVLTAGGLYLIQGGEASVIHADFAATEGANAVGTGRYLNARINEATISRIKAGLDNIP